MRKGLTALIAGLLVPVAALQAATPEQCVRQVAQTKGLIAFWDFSLMADGAWTSYHDDDVIGRGYPVALRRIGDPKSYTPSDWPYRDEASKLTFDTSGPFGHAARFNQGYIFAEVPRSQLEGTPLDVHGRQPFTLVAWVKFTGRRHLVAGIWDEGGWNKYGGRRQIALFGGLFGSKGVIGHISATGAASYPQSTISGSQYARCRAIDGQSFANGQWVAMAMTFDPSRDLVVVYLNGTATPTHVVDPVAKDVLQFSQSADSNPYRFPWPIYSPKAFVLKFNGYNVATSSVYEHWLQVDTAGRTVEYRRTCPHGDKLLNDFRVKFDVRRDGKSLLPEPLAFAAFEGKRVSIPGKEKIVPGDEIVTSLHRGEGDAAEQIGSEIHYTIREGAPFTFGRALGLGNEPLDHGTQLAIDGVAVFNRVLSGEELRALSFERRPPGKQPGG